MLEVIKVVGGFILLVFIFITVLLLWELSIVKIYEANFKKEDNLNA